jgi:hypothetical protein
VFTPWRSYLGWSRAAKRILAVLALGGIVGLLVVMLPFFFLDRDPGCRWCQYFDCIDFTPGFCANTAQRTPF